MSDRLISANKLMNYINGSIEAMTKVGVAIDGEYLWGLINYAIEDAPTVDAEPVRHGRWVNHISEDGATDGIYCGICDYEIDRDARYKYCPNCGAKMDESSEL